MKITVHNYEAYLLDWVEGTLSREEQAQLHLFFEEHPELDERDLLTDNLPELNPVQESGLDKVALFRAINPVGEWNANTYEEGLISSVEHQLVEEEQETLNEFLSKNPDLEVEFQLYQKAILKPDETIEANKAVLIRKPKLIVFPRVVQYAAAASIALLFMISLFWNLNSSNVSAEYAERKQLPRYVEAGKAQPFEIQGVQSSKNNAVFANYDQPLTNTVKVDQMKESGLVLQTKEALHIQVDELPTAQLALKQISHEEFELVAQEDNLVKDNSLLASAISLVSNVFKKKNETPLEQAEELIVRATEPMVAAIDKTVDYQEDVVDNRKEWKLSIGRVEISRIKYE